MHIANDRAPTMLPPTVIPTISLEAQQKADS